MITTVRYTSKETILYNDTYAIFYFYYPEANKACFQFRYLDSDHTVPIQMQYVDVTTPRHAYKVASAFLRGWTEQHLSTGWTGILDLPAPHKSRGGRLRGRPW